VVANNEKKCADLSIVLKPFPPRVHGYPAAADVLGIRLLRLGHSYYPGGSPAAGSLHGPKRYAVVFFPEGDGYFESASCPRQPIEDLSLCLQFPGEQSQRGPGQRGWNHYWMLLHGWWIEQIEAAGVIRRDQPFFQLGDRGPVVLDWFEESMRDAERGLPGRICARIPQLIYWLTSEETSRSADDSLMRKIAERLQEDPGRLWDYAKLANDHGISYATLRRRFRREFGQAPHPYVTRLRLELASRLLLEQWEVGEVARRVGMPDPAHFSRVFRRFAGVPPSRFARHPS